MKIVFYSTSCSPFNPMVERTMIPKRADDWDEIAKKYPEHEITVVSHLPGLYMFDIKGNEIEKHPENVKYVILEKEKTVDEIAETIEKLEPDYAVAIAVAGTPHDWNPIKETLIAEALEAKGIPTLAQNMNVSIGSFDKWRTNIMLRTSGMKIAKGVYVHKDIFNAEKNSRAISDNVYKEYVFLRIKAMNFPVIIKDTLGAGSMGIQIAKSYEEAEKILNSEEFNADVIVEELIEGEQFGTEIHGAKGRYSVLPPFAFSANQDGITDPYQSVKFGPVFDEKYGIKKLQKNLIEMAEALELSGTTQVDLVFKDGSWYIIELNPRWSGMTTTAAAAEGKRPYAIFMDTVLGTDKNYSLKNNVKYVMNFKIPGMSDEELECLGSIPFVIDVMQIKANIPGVDVFYSEVVFGGTDDPQELLKQFNQIDEQFPGIISPNTRNNVKMLIEKYR